jgi:hypothetical protein
MHISYDRGIFSSVKCWDKLTGIDFPEGPEIEQEIVVFFKERIDLIFSPAIGKRHYLAGVRT